MLYHVDADIDYAALGEARDAVLQREWALTRELHARGIILGAWRKTNGRGVIEVWDCESHAELNRLLASLPLAPYLQNLSLQPLSEHPLFPGGRPAAHPAHEEEPT
ncbi:MAG: hypothetical protein H6907_01020 [Hyphomicrobiales bacterium]|nr:hypothetical protein [Hyphomicrobiales bacterium]MCP5370287.1 hypothetical protein [Hyphomicrobiales bacterium]